MQYKLASFVIFAAFCPWQYGVGFAIALWGAIRYALFLRRLLPLAIRRRPRYCACAIRSEKRGARTQSANRASVDMGALSLPQSPMYHFASRNTDNALNVPRFIRVATRRAIDSMI